MTVNLELPITIWEIILGYVAHGDGIFFDLGWRLVEKKWHAISLAFRLKYVLGQADNALLMRVCKLFCKGLETRLRSLKFELTAGCSFDIFAKVVRYRGDTTKTKVHALLDLPAFGGALNPLFTPSDSEAPTESEKIELIKRSIINDLLLKIEPTTEMFWTPVGQALSSVLSMMPLERGVSYGLAPCHMARKGELMVYFRNPRFLHVLFFSINI